MNNRMRETGRFIILSPAYILVFFSVLMEIIIGLIIRPFQWVSTFTLFFIKEMMNE